MNGRQRTLAAIHGEWPDRVPVMLDNFMMAAREARVTMRRFRTDPLAIFRSFVSAVEKYNYDAILISVDTATVAGALGVKIDFPEDLPARCVGPALHDLRESLELQPPNIAKYWETQVWIEATALLRRHFRDEILVRGDCDQAPFSLACAMCGAEEWMLELATGRNRDCAHLLLQHCADAAKQFIALMQVAGADMVSTGDSPAGPDVISPRMYREFAFPYEKQVVDYARSLQIPHVLHICGNTSRILEDMVATGSDALELDYKTDVLQAHNVLKDVATFVGNLDPSGVLALGSPELVEQETIRLLEIFSDTPRFILGSGCSIPADTPPANIQAMVQAARRFRN